MKASHPSEAADLLDEVARVRHATRAALSCLWFPLVVFGALSCVSAAVSWRLGGDALGVYWAVAAPLGSAVTALFYHLEERRVGLELSTGRWVPAVAVILVGAFGTGALGGALGAEMVSAVGPPLFVSLGYSIFARIERSIPLGIVAVALAAFTVAVAVSGVSADGAASMLAVTYGVAFLVTGVVLQRQRSRPA